MYWALSNVPKVLLHLISYLRTLYGCVNVCTSVQQFLLACGLRRMKDYGLLPSKAQATGLARALAQSIGSNKAQSLSNKRWATQRLAAKKKHSVPKRARRLAWLIIVNRLTSIHSATFNGREAIGCAYRESPACLAFACSKQPIIGKVRP
ncbi:hypothetical protein BGZ63DRAFT_48965 [Mariannaea sp. PMI_226]|nr:hypothetical protein BGZ63DRAFT_48965 [Mariannaea sp. PMI_226]